MFRNYFKIAYRNLLKSKVASVINLIGLSIAIGCSITSYLFIEMRYSMDAFHEHADRIFIAENVIDRDGSRQLWADSPMPLGPAMAADFPQIERAVRVAYGGGTMRYEDKVFQEGLWFVDEGFFDVLTFPLRYGDPGALADPNALILSAQAAERYFGEENPVGRSVSITFSKDRQATFTVAGVAAPFPENAGISFNLLTRYDRLQDVSDERLDDWSRYTGATFLLLHNPADIADIAAGMDRYKVLQNAASEDWPIAAFEFVPLRKLSLQEEARGRISGGPPPAAAISIGLIGLFLLALACLNYMNIAIATAARRLKEIGVRKVVGSSRRQIALQFLTENVLLCLLALTLGVLAARFFLVPGFNALFGEMGMPRLSVALGENLRLWGFLLALLVGTGLASGAYPAFYVSSFKPIAIFKGSQALGGGSLFMRSFLTFQFVLAFITMITGVILTQNARYQSQRDWGYNQENTLVVPLSDPAHYAMLRDEAAQNPNVLAYAGAPHHVGRSRGYSVVDIQGQKLESVRFDVGHDYLETIGVRLKAGRLFERAHGGDAAGSILVNELFVRNAGWDDPIGQQVRFDSTTFTVAGVVEDFHYANFFQEIQPALFRLKPDEAAYRFLVLRVAPGAGIETGAAMEAAWKRLVPDAPYEGVFQDTVFDRFYRDSANISKVFSFTALMALLISCMGLFGLASQNIARRMREISIRKVLGATVVGVTSLVNRKFVVLMAVAAVVATPASYFLAGAFLDGVFEYRTPIGPLPFFIAYALVFATAVLTMSTQLYRVATANPARELRNE